MEETRNELCARYNRSDCPAESYITVAIGNVLAFKRSTAAFTKRKGREINAVELYEKIGPGARRPRQRLH